MNNTPKLILGILSLFFWFSSFFVWKYFDTNRTTIAQPESGRVYPLNTHGSIVYLTSGEHYFLYALIVFGIVFFLLAIVFHLIGGNHL